MDTLRTLRNITISLGLSLSTQVQAQMSESNNQFLDSLSWSCTPQITDFFSFSESYTIRENDTFSGLAAARWINYSDFLLYLYEFNPGVNIDLIRPWESYFVLSSDVSQEQIDQNRLAIEQRQHIDRVSQLWDEWKIEELEELIGFSITPSLPINLWLRRFHEVTASMMSQWYDRTARSALPRLEHVAVCKNTVTQYVHASLWFNTTGVINEYADILAREGWAWLFPGFLVDAWLFSRKEEYDLRENFNRNFWKWWNAILDQYESRYSHGLLWILDHLRSKEAIWAYIPTLFHYTGYAATAREESWNRDINSHIFLAHWSWFSPDYDESKYNFIHNLTWDIRPTLLELVRDQWRKYFTIPTDSQLLHALSVVHEYIWIELKYQDGTYINLQFDSNLNIINLNNIDIDSVIWFRITGAIVSDWLQVTEGTEGINYTWEEASEVKVIEHRLLFDWIALGVGHHVDIFHPTSVLTASSELLDARNPWIEWDYTQRTSIKRFFDITREELLTQNWDPREMYLHELSIEVFWVPYSTLQNPNERAEIDTLYHAHSLALQMLWYHSFWWTSWNPWSTDVNAPIPLLDILSDEDVTYVEKLYSEYIAEKRTEYLRSVEAECSSWNHQLYPIFYIKYFLEIHLLIYGGYLNYMLVVIISMHEHLWMTC